ncbi:MAG: PBP1A family penicillin-binding protein [Pseudomonadota bacterium]
MLRLAGTFFASLVIATLFGVLGMTGIVEMYGRDLPGHDELVDYRPKLLSRVYSTDGVVMAEYATEQRVFVPVEEVPDMVKHAFISAEDKNFYEHPGVDAIGIAKAMARFAQARLAGQSVRVAGASTITQQVMKNFLLDSDRTIERKIKEAILAVRIDGALTKDQILELYLNEIFFGARSYGIVAAARTYFDKRLDELEPHEAAYLAGLPKEPSNLHPIDNRDRATARRNYVLREMRENGYLPDAAYEEARGLPLGTVLDEARTVRVAEGGPLGFFTAEVRRQVSSELGREELFEGGLAVRATVDPRLQAAAGAALRRGLEAYDREQGTWRGPLATLENVPAPEEETAWRRLLARADVPRDVPGWRLAVVFASDQRAATIGIEGVEGTHDLEINGETWIRRRLIEGQRLPRPTWAQDLWAPGDLIFVAEDPEDPGDWDLRQLPAVQGAFAAMDPETGRVLALWGGFSYDQSVFNRATQAKRQPGSSFKPFVYAAALDAGYTPATVVNDAPVAVRLSNGETWRPKNSSGDAYGPTPLRRGLELSRNLMTVRIAQQVGMDRVATYAERFGVYENMPHHLAFALGAGETTLYNMVAAYGMFVNGGKKLRPTVVDRIQDRRGRTIYRHDPRGCEGCAVPAMRNAPLPTLIDQRQQIMNPSTAFQIVSMMEGVVNQGTATRTVGGTGLPLAGKTGTTNDSKDAWFIGFSPKLVAGCFIGFDNPTPMGRGAYGGTLCGPVFKEFMVAAHEGVEDPGVFSPPDQSGLVTVKIDRATGRRLADDAVGPNVVVEVFKLGNEPILFAEASALAGDSILFGTDLVQGALPFSLDDDNQSGGGMIPSSGPSGGTRPARPSPPAAVGFGTGGLY